jgi:alpha-galactosidase
VQADTSRFPYGIKDLVDWLHERGFKFGLYLAAGIETCSSGGRPLPIPGSYGHYEQDAKTIASWGVDYLKFDWCGTTLMNGTKLNQQVQTTEMAKALNKTGRTIWFNFHCGNPPQEWCRKDGNSFRIGRDHHDNWDNTQAVINTMIGLGKGSGPFHWNDPDFLMTAGAGCDRFFPAGNHCPGMTDVEYRTEFTLWCLTSAPLLVSTDLRNITPLQREILLNKELVAIDQDPLGISGDLIGSIDCEKTNTASPGACQIWGKPITGDRWAVALFNAGSSTHTISFDFKLIGHAGARLNVRNLWLHQDMGEHHGSFQADVPSHGVVAITLWQN